jgi:uncharacterized membrane protein (DUF2068 family)
VYHGLLLLLAIFLFLVISGAGIISGDRDAMLITGAVGTILAALLTVLAVPGLVTGFGLLRYRPWSRILAIVLGALHLLSFPIGTAVGVYALWALLNPETQRLFERPATAVTSA